MGARFPLIPIVVMAVGLSGCFESQRDETFEDTVVLDDVDVRVLNATADAPELTLDVDDEARAEDLAFTEADEFSLPANHYRFRVRGDTGEEDRVTLLDSAQDNLEEGRRHDLVLAGSLEDDSRQVVLFREDDETFEGETQEDRDEENEDGDDSEADEDRPLEEVRLRAAHLARDLGQVDLYLDDDPGESLDRDPDATLDFANRSEPLLVEEDVYRLRVTEAGNAQSVVYDSGSDLDFEFDQDLLLMLVPSTGVDTDSSPVSLVVVDDMETTLVPDTGRQGGVQAVNAAATEDDVEVCVEKDRLDPLDFGEAVPGKDILDYEPLDADAYDISVYDGSECTIATREVRVSQGRGLSALLVESEDDADTQELLVLNNDDRPVATNARVRAVHAASGSRKDVDIYLLPEDESLSEDGTVRDPWIQDLGYLARSRYRPVPGGDDYRLVVTEEGDSEKRLLDESPISLEKGGNYRLVIAGDDDTDDEVDLIQLGGVR